MHASFRCLQVRSTGCQLTETENAKLNYYLLSYYIATVPASMTYNPDYSKTEHNVNYFYAKKTCIKSSKSKSIKILWQKKGKLTSIKVEFVYPHPHKLNMFINKFMKFISYFSQNKLNKSPKFYLFILPSFININNKQSLRCPF